MAKILVSNEIKKRYLLTLFELFADDPEFTYNKSDQTKGKILITARYAAPKSEAKLPQIVIGLPGFQSAPSSFMNNFLGEVNVRVTEEGVPTGGTITGKQYSNIVNYNASFDVMSTVKQEAERIADLLNNMLTMEYVELFNLMGLRNRGVAVAEAVPKQQYPQYQYISTLSLQGDTNLTWTAYMDEKVEKLFNHLSVIVQTEEF